MKKVTNVLFIAAALGLAAPGCKSLSKSQKGVLIGAGAGGAVGAGVGAAAGNTALGAIIGAAVGGAAGGIIGKKMDKQAEEIAQIPGAEVKRVGEGINVTFDSGVLFGYDKSDISQEAVTKLNELAGILTKYPDTYVLVEGHTDSNGSESYNMDLSKRIAKSVASYLRQNNVTENRIRTAAYGEGQPKFTNDSDENKAKNRRVEFAIYANEKLINEAKKEAAAE
jgi:outer membrane protein OmpA-like peptidoglycan-associated protein